jgi:proteic killer suppression protein
MIRSFGDRRTKCIYNGERARGFPQDLLRVTERKLDMIQNAHALDDLRVPPGNRLEALRGGLEGFYSIRVNDKWRIIFRWRNNHAEDVSVTDYH